MKAASNANSSPTGLRQIEWSCSAASSPFSLPVHSGVWVFLSSYSPSSPLHVGPTTNARRRRPSPRLHWRNERCRYGLWRNERLESRPTTSQIPKGDWWEIFGDAELNELKAWPRRQSTAQSCRRCLAEARAQMDVTRAGLFPNVSLSGSYTRQRTRRILHRAQPAAP